MEVSVSAGDLVLFSRPCFAMDLGSSLICFGAKIFSGSSIDHIGLVVKDPSTSELFLLEANASGVTLRPLIDRLIRSKSRIISVRKLIRRKARRQEEDIIFRQRLWSIAQEYAHYGYNSSIHINAHAVVQSHLHHMLHQPHQDRVRYAYTLHVLQNEAVHVDGVVSQLIQLRCQQLQDRLEASVRGDQALLASIDELQRTNCSQLVAQIYAEMGILTPTREVLHYIPSDFSSLNFTHTIHLEDGYALSPNITFDKSQIKIHQSHGVAHFNITSLSRNDAFPFTFSEGNIWRSEDSARLSVKNGRVHVFDQDERMIAEMSEKDPPLTLAKGCMLYAYRGSAVEISVLDGDQSVFSSDKSMSAFIQREILAGIDTVVSGGFVEVERASYSANVMIR